MESQIMAGCTTLALDSLKPVPKILWVFQEPHLWWKYATVAQGNVTTQGEAKHKA